MGLKISNRWHFAAALIAGAAFLAHEVLGGAEILRRAMTAPADAGAAGELAFNLWNSAGALMGLLAAAFLGAAFLGRAPFLAGAATLMAVLAALLPAVFVGVHQQPVLAAFQVAAFGAMAGCGLIGIWTGARAAPKR